MPIDMLRYRHCIHGRSMIAFDICHLLAIRCKDECHLHKDIVFKQHIYKRYGRPCRMVFVTKVSSWSTVHDMMAPRSGMVEILLLFEGKSIHTMVHTDNYHIGGSQN